MTRPDEEVPSSSPLVSDMTCTYTTSVTIFAMDPFPFLAVDTDLQGNACACACYYLGREIDIVWMNRIVLLPCSDISVDLINQCAEMLVDYWGGHITTRKASILQQPGSFSLISTDAFGVSTAVGYAKITYSCGSDTNDSSSSSDGCGIVTSVVVNKINRGIGLGRTMMTLLETEAIRMGCCFLYLWTTDAVQFYAKLGYRNCPRLTESVSAFRTMDSSAVSALEKMMSTKLAALCNGRTSSDNVDCELHTSAETVYMKKRLVHEHPLIEFAALDEFATPIARGIQREKSAHHPRRYITTHMISLPWSHQIGPSCGIQAIRMVEAVLRPDKVRPVLSQEEQGRTSLLQRAIDMGFSSNGEMFDINSVVTLVRDIGLCAAAISIDELGWDGIRAILHPSDHRPQGLIIFAYDKGKMGFLPDKFGGRHAHFGVVCGYAVSSRKGEPSTDTVNVSGSIVDIVSGCKHSFKHEFQPSFDECRQCDIEEGDYRALIVMQGMHNRPVVALFDHWRESNAQLFGDKNTSYQLEQELRTNKGWIIPPSGPNLRGVCVVVTP